MSETRKADMSAQAKDLAEAANVSVESFVKLASFLDEAFGGIVSNSVGLLGDKLKYYRLERAILLHEGVEKRLKDRGVSKRFVPVSIGLPIIEKATVEDEPLLQEKWANLLANALDETFERPIRRNYTSMLSEMETVDAQILDLIISEYLALRVNKDSALFSKAKVSQVLRVSPDSVEITLRNLFRLGLLKPGVVSGGGSIGDHAISSYKDTELFGVTLLGVDFYFAVNDRNAGDN